MAPKFKFISLVLFTSDFQPWLLGDSNVQALKKKILLSRVPSLEIVI